jgi:hypothetical protein
VTTFAPDGPWVASQRRSPWYTIFISTMPGIVAGGGRKLNVWQTE